MPLDHAEADDDVGDLHAGVVDVVLHLDRDAAEAQHAHQRVAERGIAQMADVRRLVRVDGRVLDDGFARSAGRGRSALCEPKAIEQKRRPFEKEVQVSVGRGGHAVDALERAERGGNLLRDRARRLAQPAGQLERDRRAESPRSRFGGYSSASGSCADWSERVERREQAREVRAKSV